MSRRCRSVAHWIFVATAVAAVPLQGATVVPLEEPIDLNPDPETAGLTPPSVEVWIEQRATGEVEYYRLEGASPGVDELPGRFDREGFTP